MVVVIIHQTQADLVQMMLALHPPPGLASHLHCGKQQAGEHTDHAKRDKQLDQGRGSSPKPIKAQQSLWLPRGSCLHGSFLLHGRLIRSRDDAQTDAISLF
jgi:hypothetical protein